MGVDVGTTFTAAAVWRGGRVEVVPLGNHAAAIPSLVFLRDDGGVLVGDVAERRGLGEPSRLAREFKRRLGDTAPIMLDRTPFSADRLLGLLLRAVVVDVVERQGGVADVVVVTHPANWGEYKLDLLRQAVVLAGVPGALLLSEPVAAALQFAAGARVEVGEVVAVYDLGGGTFDAAVLRKSVGGFEVLGRGHGIERLGGIDFDEAVLTHVRGVVGDVIGGLDAGDVGVRAAFARLRAECVLAKESLSADSDASVSVLLPNVQMQVRITRVEFEDMIRPILRETVECVRRAVDAAGVGLGEVKVVLLAGGSSRIPLVADMVRGELGRPVVSDVHPKHSVAMGAARYGAGVLAANAPSAAAPAPVPPAPPAPPPTATRTPVPAAPAPSVPPAVSAAAVSAAAVGAAASSAPKVQPGVAAAQPARTGPPPVAPPAPSRAAPPPPPAKKPRSQWMLLGAGLLAVVAGIVALVMFTGGDDGTAGDTTTQSTADQTIAGTASTVATESTTATSVTTAVTSATTATTVNVNQSCSSTTGICVGISSALWQGDVLEVLYTVDGFDPNDSGVAGDSHVHFFYSTVDPNNAGVPETGPWMVWDRADGGGELVFNGFTQSNLSEFGYQPGSAICITQANHDHTLAEAENYYCYPVPTPGQ